MKRTTRLWRFGRNATGNVGRIAACLALVGAGVLIGAGWSPMGATNAVAQPADQPQHFQSGGQLALPVLMEIAATLKQMDARLARLETAAQQLRPARGNAAAAK